MKTCKGHRSYVHETFASGPSRAQQRWVWLAGSPWVLACCVLLVASYGLAGADISAAQDKDYLSAIEADKIRDAGTTNDRIKIFLTFADDRLKKFQYELEHPSPTKHFELLNSLMNAYSGCVDDAADLIQLGIRKQENVRPGIDLMAARAAEFLVILQKYSANGADLDLYKDTLDDAMESTQDALKEAENAKKKVAPPPVRRKNAP